jgi:hypothetical protein
MEVQLVTLLDKRETDIDFFVEQLLEITKYD